MRTLVFASTSTASARPAIPRAIEQEGRRVERLGDRLGRVPDEHGDRVDGLLELRRLARACGLTTTGMAKRIAPDAEATPLNTPGDLEAFARSL